VSIRPVQQPSCSLILGGIMSLPFSSMVFLYSPVIFYHFSLDFGLFLGKLTTYRKKIARLRERRNRKNQQKSVGFNQKTDFHLSETRGLSKHLTEMAFHHDLPLLRKKTRTAWSRPGLADLYGPDYRTYLIPANVCAEKFVRTLSPPSVKIENTPESTSPTSLLEL